MSESGCDRERRFYIDDMLGFCERVMAFTDGVDQANFVGEAMRFDATVRNLD